jgi:hypothetical protein
VQTAEEIFQTNIRSLPLDQRLRLAELILEDAGESAISLLGFSDEWSDEDIQDLTTYSARVAEERYPEENPLV